MYVDNKRLYSDICEWLTRRESDAEAPMGEYTASAIILIANNLVKRYNFSGYTWRDEMVGDGVECCVKYLKNFNPEYKNPHAYITRICFSAFVNRIKRENRYNQTKYKLYLQDVVDIEEVDADGRSLSVDYGFYKNIGEKLKEEKKETPEKEKERVPGPLEEFL